MPGLALVYDADRLSCNEQTLVPLPRLPSLSWFEKMYIAGGKARPKYALLAELAPRGGRDAFGVVSFHLDTAGCNLHRRRQVESIASALCRPRPSASLRRLRRYERLLRASPDRQSPPSAGAPRAIRSRRSGGDPDALVRAPARAEAHPPRLRRARSVRARFAEALRRRVHEPVGPGARATPHSGLGPRSALGARELLVSS